MARPEDRTFDPDAVEANRIREQGGGVGRRELEAQRDPARATESDREQDEANRTLDEGAVELAPGHQQGRTNTNREFPDESDDVQGGKTVRANRRKVRGAPDMNP